MEFKVTPNHVLGFLAVLILSAAIYLSGNKPVAPPAPILAAPAIPSAGTHVCPAPKPFLVTCPHCHNPVLVTPRETGALVSKATGQAVGK